MSRNRIARVFDGDGDAPVEGPGRTTLPDPQERARVVEFLDGGEVLAAGGPLSPDVLAPDHPVVVPAGYATDGTWIWSASLRYYVATHGLAPEPDLLAHIRAHGYRARTPTPAELAEAQSDLYAFFRTAT
jgi:hypothetical protein